MCAVKNDDKNKINLPPPSFHSLFNCWKSAKISDIQFVLWKMKSNCMNGLFCIANLLEVDRKKTFF